MDLLVVLLLLLLLCLLSSLLWTFYVGFRAHLWSKFVPVDLVTRFGTWAVVTGCTDGIGKEYAKELAKRGMNIVLISRNPDKLNQVSQEITSLYNVETKIIIADFSKGQAVFNKIKNELSGISVGILVNNVGKQYTYPTYLGEVPEQDLWDIININVGATTLMTRIILNDMVQRGRGAIVNISSSSELQPLPLMTVYAATKVFIKNFSEALRYEYQSKGILIQHVSPFYVSTKMNAFSHRFETSSLLVPDAHSYAVNAVNTLTYIDNTTGYWKHGIQHFFTCFAPKWARKYIGGYMNEIFRKDYLARHNKLTVP